MFSTYLIWYFIYRCFSATLILILFFYKVNCDLPIILSCFFGIKLNLITFLFVIRLPLRKFGWYDMAEFIEKKCTLKTAQNRVSETYFSYSLICLISLLFFLVFFIGFCTLFLLVLINNILFNLTVFFKHFL